MKLLIDTIEKTILSIRNLLTFLFFSFIISLIFPEVIKDVIVLFVKLIPDAFINYLADLSLEPKEILNLYFFLLVLSMLSTIFYILLEVFHDLPTSLYKKTLDTISNLNSIIILCVGIYLVSFDHSFIELCRYYLEFSADIMLKAIIFLVAILIQVAKIYFIFLLPIVAEFYTVIDHSNLSDEKKLYAIPAYLLFVICISGYILQRL